MNEIFKNQQWYLNETWNLKDDKYLKNILNSEWLKKHY